MQTWKKRDVQTMKPYKKFLAGAQDCTAYYKDKCTDFFFKKNDDDFAHRYTKFGSILGNMNS